MNGLCEKAVNQLQTPSFNRGKDGSKPKGLIGFLKSSRLRVRFLKGWDVASGQKCRAKGALTVKNLAGATKEIS